MMRTLDISWTAVVKSKVRIEGNAIHYEIMKVEMNI